MIDKPRRQRSPRAEQQDDYVSWPDPSRLDPWWQRIMSQSFARLRWAGRRTRP